jgi:hypothetical protein
MCRLALGTGAKAKFHWLFSHRIPGGHPASKKAGDSIKIFLQQLRQISPEPFPGKTPVSRTP